MPCVVWHSLKGEIKRGFNRGCQIVFTKWGMLQITPCVDFKFVKGERKAQMIIVIRSFLSSAKAPDLCHLSHTHLLR